MNVKKRYIDEEPEEHIYENTSQLKKAKQNHFYSSSQDLLLKDAMLERSSMKRSFPEEIVNDAIKRPNIYCPLTLSEINRPSRDKSFQLELVPYKPSFNIDLAVPLPLMLPAQALEYTEKETKEPGPSNAMILHPTASIYL